MHAYSAHTHTHTHTHASGHTIVTVLCDSGFRYGSKFFNKQWMMEKELYDVLPPEHRVGIE